MIRLAISYQLVMKKTPYILDLKFDYIAISQCRTFHLLKEINIA